MATAADAREALKTRVGTVAGLPIYWQGDIVPPLPGTPAAFGFAVFNNEGAGAGPAGYGGGRGRNLWRNRAMLEVYVFEPALADGAAGRMLANAETVAARLRSYRDDVVSCFSADVIPIGPGSSISVPGLNGPVNNYQCAVAEIDLVFDQVG
jgi:hypothetical protein